MNVDTVMNGPTKFLPVCLPEISSFLNRRYKILKTKMKQDMCVINDPLTQVHFPASNDQYFHLTIVLSDFEDISRF